GSFDRNHRYSGNKEKRREPYRKSIERESMNSIEIKNLTYSYPGASAPTLKDINLEIEKGDFLAIVGNNGCGKSTLCKVMNGLIPHFITGEFQGDVLVGGISTL